MTWLSLLATIVGAIIALGSALIVERRRERREEVRERRRTKQDLYARYLAAHAGARARLRIVAATSGLSDEERANQAREAYASCYATRYELEVLAPQTVVSAAGGFNRRARALRDVIIEGTDVETQGADRMREYLNDLRLVRAAMRVDLGSDVNG
ncbi:hypothetical protein [Streptomyces capoamus]|uniref:hypothetical protein n=1 Tax=Streptomyces capoamus TaxID=68183 RepID=UPI00339AE473